MKNMNKRLFALCFMLSFCFAGFSQTCSLVGWASQNGGVTGGGTATPTVVSNYTDFKNAVTNTAVKVIHVSGTITFPSAGRITFQDQSAKTIYGLPGSKLVSTDITAAGSGILYIKRLTNVVFRNLTFEGPGAYDTDGNDNMTIDNCTNIWVDHCDFQDGVDGNLDIKNLTDYVSVTWCRFVYLKPPIPGGSGGADDHRFSNLFGSSDGATGDRGKLRITMYNCWWAQGCKERMPRVRFGKVHLVNNYFSCSGNNHCVRAGFEADLRVEANSFENVNTPIDLFENDFTAVQSISNQFVGTSGNTAGSGTAFTPPYSLTVAPAANVKSQVMAGAGATLSSPTCGGGTTYTMTTTASPTAGGSVSGAGTYSSGASASLTATANSGYTFTGWSGDASGSTNPISVTMNANKSVTATFTAATTYTLTTTASPTAGGTVSGGGNYASGATATVTATPAAGYTFTGWSGAATGATNPVTVTMNANKSITATFTVTTTNYTLTTTASPTAGGSVTGAGTYASGATATVTATANAGYTFTGWSGAATGTTNPLGITMNANKSVTANFTLTGGTSTIRIEDNATASTGLCLVEGSISSNSGANNTKVINLTNSTAKGINWKVNAPSAGSYTLVWRYVNSSSSNTYTMKLLVNGATINSAQPFPKTSSSTTFLTSTATVSLATGGNIIRLESVAANATADIDWIEITGTSPTAGDCNAAKTVPMMLAVPLVKAGVYPNPSKGEASVGFYLQEADNVSIAVMNAEGKMVSAQSMYLSAGYHQQKLKLNKQPGLFVVVVSGERKGKEVFKLIVE
jgi:uncharacterized repeat protein (TIGR02543 family)